METDILGNPVGPQPPGSTVESDRIDIRSAPDFSLKKLALENERDKLKNERMRIELRANLHANLLRFGGFFAFMLLVLYVASHVH